MLYCYLFFSITSLVAIPRLVNPDCYQISCIWWWLTLQSQTGFWIWIAKLALLFSLNINKKFRIFSQKNEKFTFRYPPTKKAELKNCLVLDFLNKRYLEKCISYPENKACDINLLNFLKGIGLILDFIVYQIFCNGFRLDWNRIEQQPGYENLKKSNIAITKTESKLLINFCYSKRKFLFTLTILFELQSIKKYIVWNKMERKKQLRLRPGNPEEYCVVMCVIFVKNDTICESKNNVTYEILKRILKNYDYWKTIKRFWYWLKHQCEYFSLLITVIVLNPDADACKQRSTVKAA